MELRPEDEELRQINKKTKDKEKKKIKIKTSPIIICITVVSLVIIFGLIIYNIQTDKYRKKVIEQYNNVCVQWLENFANSNFEYCDKLVDDKDKLTTIDNEYYSYAINQLSQTINEIEVKEISGNTCTLQITYKTYEQIDEITISNQTRQDYDEMEQKFIAGEISVTEVQSKMTDMMNTTFRENCFKEGSVRTEVIVLSTEDVNGVTYVRGTIQFINTILKDSNLQNNLDVFQNQINEKLKQIVKEN